MNCTTVVQSEENVKDFDELSESMQNSQDTLVLLNVISVLSTLLIVIFIVACLWICAKYCHQPSSIATGSHSNNRNRFPPPSQRDLIQMEDVRDVIQSFLEQNGAHRFAPNRTGISEKLGYKSGKHAPVPLFPPPRSWTPSPPFNPERVPDHCQMCEEHIHSCLLNSDNPRCRPRDNQNIPRFEKTGKSRLLHFCPNELQERLEYLQEPSNIPPRDLSNSKLYRSISGYEPPTNTPDSNFCSRETGRESDCTYQSFVENIPNGSRLNKLKSDQGLYSRDLNASIRSNIDPFAGKDGIYLRQNDSHCSRENNLSTRRMLNSSTRATPLQNKDYQGNINGHSGRLEHDVFPANDIYNHKVGNIELKNSGTLPRRSKRKRLIIKNRPNQPQVFLESPSSESSSNMTQALNKSSKLYWKIYHQSENEGNGYNEDSTPDPTPSMSWDHLTPDPSPIHESYRPRVNLDPSTSTAFYSVQAETEKNDGQSQVEILS